MIFSRVLVAAIAVVGVIATSSNAPGTLYTDSPGAIDLEPRGESPYNVAMTKFDSLQDRVADAMAGPKAEREAKFLAITSDALQVLKDYKGAAKNGFLGINLNLGLGHDEKGKEMKEIGSAIYHILRSCKGTRSTQLGDNIASINSEIDDLGVSIATLFPSIASKLLPGFGMYAERLSAIEAAVRAH